MPNEVPPSWGYRFSQLSNKADDSIKRKNARIHLGLDIEDAPHLLATIIIPLTIPLRPYHLNIHLATPNLPNPNLITPNSFSLSSRNSASGVKQWSEISRISMSSFL